MDDAYIFKFSCYIIVFSFRLKKGLGFRQFASQQTPGLLQRFQIGECIFGDQEKRPAVKVQMKEKRCFQKTTEFLPGPCVGSSFCLQNHFVIIKIHTEMILEGHRSPIYAERKYCPESNE